MKSLADALPPEIAQKIHPDWRKNEAAYWSMRDRLVGQYQDRWIAFAEGAVLAACKTSLEVLHTPGVMERYPFVICVGREDQPYRVRRATFAYDPTYPGQALLLRSAEFRSVSGSAGSIPAARSSSIREKTTRGLPFYCPLPGPSHGSDASGTTNGKCGFRFAMSFWSSVTSSHPSRSARAT